MAFLTSFNWVTGEIYLRAPPCVTSSETYENFLYLLVTPMAKKKAF